MKNSRTQFFRNIPDVSGKLSMQITPQSIQESALFVFGVSKIELESRSRKRNAAECRHVIAGLLDKYTTLRHVQILKYSGNRERSTISHSIDVFKDLCESDKVFAKKVINVEQRLEGVCA
ncbi:helix-turn-helix domain-containing protein [Pedobacter sp. WC2423]|uniref:helix-turn-helix domain-containing protein n=1 Tax=Pedobacter sp. WC2423 TaxID=3234142 RepID=UPI0034666F81